MVIAERVEFLPESGADFRIGNPDIGNLESCDIECFTWCGAENHLLRRFFVDGGKGDVLVALIGKVGVYFIGNNFHAVADTDVGIGFQFFFRPYSSGRIVGRTKNGKFHMIFCHFSFDISEIKFIVTVFEHQRAVDQFSPIILYGKRERVIDGTVNENGVIFFCQRFDGKVDGRNDTGCFDKPFGFRVPLEMMKKPVMDSFEIRGFCFGVAVNGMVYPFLQSFRNAVGNGKIHIGNPERQYICRLSLFFCKVEFHGVRIFSVNNGVEVGEFHSVSFLSVTGSVKKRTSGKESSLHNYFNSCFQSCPPSTTRSSGLTALP